MRSTGRAFTLIELLIVVAIIGILAAIAVPNFLNAQTRAKVSRIQADAQALGTAIESYKLDTNEYLPDGRSGVYSHYSLKWGSVPSSGKHLTTPIAYMGSIPIDPFNSTTGYTPIANPEESQKAMFFLNRKYNEGVNSWEPGLPYDHLFQGVSWFLYSVGPSLDYGFRADMDCCWIIPYDSSNGLRSQGGIWRIGS